MSIFDRLIGVKCVKKQTLNNPAPPPRQLNLT